MMFTKTQSSLLGLLFVCMAVASTHFFEWGMMGLTGFILAYSTKGLRRYHPKDRRILQKKA